MRKIDFQCTTRVERKDLHYAFRTCLYVTLVLRKANEYQKIRKKEGKKKHERVDHSENVRKVAPRYLFNYSLRTGYRKILIITVLQYDYTVKQTLTSFISISTRL